MFFINYGLWMEDSFDLALTALGTVTIVIAIAEIIGEFIVIAIADRLGPKTTSMAGMLTAAISFSVIPSLSFSLPLAMFGIFVMFIGIETAIVASLPLFSELLPQSRSVMMSANMGAHSLGRVIGAALGGFIYAASDGSFAFIGLVAGGLGLLGFIIMRRFIPGGIKAAARMTATGNRMIKQTLTNALIACMTVLLTLILLEAAVRVIGDTDIDGQFTFMGYALEPRALPISGLRAAVEEYLGDVDQAVAVVLYDEMLGWTYRPNAAWQKRTFTTNSAGLRAQREYSKEPPPDTLRIALFGDSFTAGDEAANDKIWGHQLEAKLNHGIPRRSPELWRWRIRNRPSLSKVAAPRPAILARYCDFRLPVGKPRPQSQYLSRAVPPDLVSPLYQTALCPDRPRTRTHQLPGNAARTDHRRL